MEEPNCGDFINEEGRTIPKYNPKTGMRYFTEEECGACEGNWSGGPTYECLKKAGGSYSWDHRKREMPMVLETDGSGSFDRVDSGKVGEFYVTINENGRLEKIPATAGTYLYNTFRGLPRFINVDDGIGRTEREGGIIHENSVFKMDSEGGVVYPRMVNPQEGNIFLATGVAGKLKGPLGTANILTPSGTYYYDGDSSFERLEMPQDADVSIMRFARGGERPETVPNCPLEE